MAASTSLRDVAAVFHVGVLVRREKSIRKGCRTRVAANDKKRGRDPSITLLNGQRPAGIGAAGSKPAVAVLAAAAGVVGAAAAAEQGAFHAS